MNRLATLLALGSAVLLFGDPLTDVFARMDNSAKTFKGMTADLKETVHTEIVNDNTVSTGTIKLRSKPGDVRFLIDFTNPDAPRSVSLSDKEARLYNPKTKIVQVFDLADKKGLVEQLFLLGFGASSAEIKANYDVTWVGSETIDGKPTGHLKMIPKSKDILEKLRQADLWISDSLGVPLQQKIATNSSGDYTMFNYSNIRLNPSLSEQDVQLKTPKGVEIKRVGK